MAESEARLSRNLALLSGFEGRDDGTTEPDAAVVALETARNERDDQ